jgi:hypothetical protein
MNDNIRYALVAIVGGGWLFNLIAPAFIESYDNNLAANGPLLLILGSLFTSKPKKTGSDSGDE